MFLKIFFIGKALREIKSNPSRFARGEARDALLGLFIIPIIIVALGLILLFILGFTSLIGGPYLFFKIVFFIGLFISIILGLIIKKIISVATRTTTVVVDKTIKEIEK